MASPPAFLWGIQVLFPIKSLHWGLNQFKSLLIDLRWTVYIVMATVHKGTLNSWKHSHYKVMGLSRHISNLLAFLRDPGGIQSFY